MRISAGMGVAVGIFLLPGCELFRPEPPPQTAHVTPAKKQPSAAVPLGDARRLTNEADRHSATAESRLRDAKDTLAWYRGKTLNLSEMVKKLQLAGSAAATDLKLLYDELQSQDDYIIELGKKMGLIQEDLVGARLLRDKANEKLDETAAKLVAKEQEANTLRQQLSDADVTISELEQNAADNFERAQKANSAADKIRGQRRMLAWTLLGVTVFALISLVVNYIQFRSSRLLPL